ncbi:MAG: trypsin-like peptidase domain-containing protein [Burkholderiaceae bacterium]
MLRKLWLTFAQTATICLAVLFALTAWQPQWLPASLQHSLGEASSSAPAGGVAPDDEVPAEDAARGGRHGAGRAESASETVDPRILSYSAAAQRALPSVVNIFTAKETRLPPNHPLNDPAFRRRYQGDRFSPRQQASSLGSGVIVSSDGLLLTNHHVIDTANQIEVLLTDGRRTRAKVIGGDPETDLALLRTELTDLPAVDFADAEQARIGDVVLAIGNPFGVGQTVTMGIISALGRSQLGINTFENFIQTDAAINPGNSGGALVDTEGRLLGINTAIYSRTGGSLGIGFAIPVSTARQVIDQIAQFGSVTRGYIGVEPQDVTPELADAFKLARRDGTIIAGVMKSGPAEKAGVKIGDILFEVDGKPVRNTTTMLNVIAGITPGTQTVFRFLREGRELDLPITVGKRPTSSR